MEDSRILGKLNGGNNNDIKSYKTELLSCQKVRGTYTPPSENPIDTELVSTCNPLAPQYFLQQCFSLYYKKEIGYWQRQLPPATPGYKNFVCDGIRFHLSLNLSLSCSLSKKHNKKTSNQKKPPQEAPNQTCNAGEGFWLDSPGVWKAGMDRTTLDFAVASLDLKRPVGVMKMLSGLWLFIKMNSGKCKTRWTGYPFVGNRLDTMNAI